MLDSNVNHMSPLPEPLIFIAYCFAAYTPIFVIDHLAREWAERKLGFKLHTFGRSWLWFPDLPAPTEAQEKAAKRLNRKYLLLQVPLSTAYMLTALFLFGVVSYKYSVFFHGLIEPIVSILSTRN